jgi:hypothetical protein
MINKKTLLGIVFIIAIYFIITRIIMHHYAFSSNNNIEHFSSTISTDKASGFCNANVGNSNNLNKKCKLLTSDNCKSTSCCVWTSDQQCLAGKVDGPTFNTDNNGKTKTLDYYYFENKCYGEKCL